MMLTPLKQAQRVVQYIKNSFKFKTAASFNNFTEAYDFVWKWPLGNFVGK